MKISRRSLMAGTAGAGVAALMARSASAHSAQGTLSNLPGDSVLGWPKRPAMVADMRHSLLHRSLEKPIYSTAPIDDMSRDLNWQLDGAGTLDYRSAHVRSAPRSLVLSVPSRNEEYIASRRWPNGSFMGEAFGGSTTATLNFATPQDWSGYNRLSFWIYVEGETSYPHWLMLSFALEGAEQMIAIAGGSAPYDRPPSHWPELKAGQWNHIVWEIAEYPREKVASLSLRCALIGRTTVAEDTEFHIGDISLDRVDVEQTEGWGVQPGKIAFQHVGHRPYDTKYAVVGSGAAREFAILDADDNTAFEGAVQPLRTRNGEFGLIDFSNLTAPGRYRISAGGITSDEFAIGDDVWLGTIEKNLNAMYLRRCGPAMPTDHPQCHFDVRARYQGELKVVNGSWHDAADTHVNANSTHQIIGGMMATYRALEDVEGTEALRRDLLEEICWGLDWSLKTRFGNGVRLPRVLDRFYSDNEIGNHDDPIFEITAFDAWYAAIGAYTLAEASRLLAPIDPDRAAQCRAAALEDYHAAFETGVDWPTPDPRENASFDSASENGAWAPHDTANIAYAVLACCAMYSLTRRQSDMDRAVRYADQLMSCQERGFDGSPITGFFYDRDDREAPINEVLMSTQEGIMLSLVRLCREFPDHPKWMEWYSTAAIYTDYFLGRGARASAPYYSAPSAVWTIDGFRTRVDEMIASVSAASSHDDPVEWQQRVEAQYAEQINSATPISDERRLRVFPINTTNTFRTGFIPGGQMNPLLAVAGGLASVGAFRGNTENETLAKRQLQWVLGGNPFSQSLMYGEGYDWGEMCVIMGTQSVGSLPVGLESFRGDAPYWAFGAYITPGETWGICQGHLFYLLAEIAAPARVYGGAPQGAIFTDAAGERTPVQPGGYAINLQPGTYTIAYGDMSRTVTLVGGATRRIDLDPMHSLTVELTGEADAQGAVQLSAVLTGTGTFHLRSRHFNLEGEPVDAPVTIGEDGTQTLTMSQRIADPNQPWGITLFVEGDPHPVAELFGTAASVPDMPVSAAPA